MGRYGWEALPNRICESVRAARPEPELYEIRLRAGSRMQLNGRNENRLCGDKLSFGQIREMLAALMEHSLYAWEDELADGYFTTKHGFRVGVAGKYGRVDGRLHMVEIHSVCIRLASSIPGSADRLLPMAQKRSCIILSPPGCGKTTILRDLARQLSDRGQSVAILDERCEIAAAWRGEAAMDIGERTDIIEGVEKSVGIPMIIRSLAPQVVVTDELGGETDAKAVLDAMHCGVRVMATAHAGSLQEAYCRIALKSLLDEGFDMAVELGWPPGSVRAVYKRSQEGWKRVDML